jgi:predicted ATPase
MGKTRIAEQCAELAAEAFAEHGGVWFCDLTGVVDPSVLTHVVSAVVLGTEQGESGPSSDARDLVDHFLSVGPMLLVLDNFEQLVDAADIVHGWCQAAPELSVLVTSRERLRVEGEIVVELGPLHCPSADASNSEMLGSAAVRLLVQRAKAAGGDVGMDARLLAELVRLLDGIPLAIELAAARTRFLPPAELVKRLAQRSEVLGRRPRHEGDRHATLSAAIDWSWQLLSAEEQRALAVCSVFAGDFTVSAAEALIGEHAVDLLGALRDKSLIHVASSPERLALYMSIREYAAERFAKRDPVEVEETHLRHARFFAASARAFVDSRALEGEPDAGLRGRLLRDRAHLVAALAYVRARGAEPVLVAELALGLALLQAAPAESCLGALADVLSSDDGAALGLELLAHLLLWRQTLLAGVGRFEESRTDMARLLAMDLPPTFRSLALVMQGTQLRYRGLTSEAWASHVAAGQSIDAETPARLQAMHFACMGRLGHELREYEAARENNERARVLAADIGDAWLEGLPIANLALVEQELGNFEAARRWLDEALVRFERSDEAQYVATYSIACGDLAFERGQPDEARRHYEKASPFFAGWRAHRQAVELHTAFAALEALHGAPDEAELQLERARRSLSRSPSRLLELLIEVHGAQLLLRKERDHGGRGEVHARVRARYAELVNGDIANGSFSARFALRMLAQALDGPSPTRAAPVASASIVVARDGAWFKQGEKRVDLGRRGSLRRILAALVVAPKTGASRDLLLAEGWPGERLLHDAASKRLRVAVATLRSLGLREAILTREDGYALAPAVVTEV